MEKTLKILAIDDVPHRLERNTYEPLKEAMAQEGIRLEYKIVENYKEAIEELKDGFRPDAITCDYMFGSSCGHLNMGESGPWHLEEVLQYIDDNIPSYSPKPFMLTYSTSDAKVAINRNDVLKKHNTEVITVSDISKVGDNIRVPFIHELEIETPFTRFIQQKLGNDVLKFKVYEPDPPTELEKTFGGLLDNAANLPNIDLRDETIRKSLLPDISDEDEEKTHRLQCTKSNHMPLNGYAAFTKEDVDKLRTEGKPPILFIQDYDPKIHAELVTKVAGVVCLGKGGSHFLVKGIPAVSKVQQVIWNNKTGEAIDISRIENIDGQPAVVNNSHAVIRATSEHLTDSVAPPAPQYDKKNKVFLFKAGDKVTLARTAAYQGHLWIEYPNLESVIESVNALAAQLPFKTPKFLANAPASSDFNEAANHISRSFRKGAQGVGLVRTENMLEPAVLKSIKEGIINNDRSKFTCLNDEVDAINGVLIASFSSHDSIEPQQIRIRLFDFPPDETFSAEELRALKARVGDTLSGTPLALKTEGLYEEQLKSIFTKAKRDGYDPHPVVQIMAPHIRTAEEMARVKEMAEKAAEEVGLPRKAFEIGTMMETVSACNPEEAAKIAKLCDFVSFGTNDLTQEITDIPRNIAVEGIDPYVTLDDKVKDTMRIATKAMRTANPNIKISCCGGQMGDYKSLKFCAKELRLDEVSTPPDAMSLIGRRLQIMQELAKSHNLEHSTANGLEVKSVQEPARDNGGR